MSQEHVEIVRRAFDALNRGDLSGAMKDMAADFVFDFSRSMSPERGVYGREDIPRLQDFPERHRHGRRRPARGPEHRRLGGHHQQRGKDGRYRRRRGERQRSRAGCRGQRQDRRPAGKERRPRLGASSSNTIADRGIQSIDVKDDTLTGAHVANNSLPGADLADNSVTSAKIADTSVTAADLAPVQSPLQPQLENCVGSTQWDGGPAQAEQPAFWKDPFGVVHLEGAVGCPDNADEGTVIFNFPPGFRPPVFSVLRYGALGGGQTLVQLATTSDGGGARLVYDGPDGDAIDDYISLDGITFRTEG